MKRRDLFLEERLAIIRRSLDEDGFVVLGQEICRRLEVHQWFLDLIGVASGSRDSARRIRALRDRKAKS